MNASDTTFQLEVYFSSDSKEVGIIKTYNEVYHTPRIIYRKILNIICGREELNYQIVGYEDVYEELRLQSRILKVINVE